MSAKTKTKHTPGPWAVTEVGVNPGIEGPDVSIVVFGEGGEDYCGVQGRTAKEARANAHLIAAAPALYEALKDALDNCIWRADKTPTISEKEAQRLFDKCYAAIAKAEGAV